MTRYGKRRKGAVVLLVAVSLTALMSMVAIAVDGGLLLDRHRQVQSAADMAALAAANSLFSNYVTNEGLDPNGTAAAEAKAAAAANGYPNATVNIPPQSGPFTGQAGYAEVIIQYNQKRYFSTIFGTSDISVAGRAVARGLWVPARIGIQVLNPTAPGALTNTGNGAMTVVGVPTLVNSNSPTAATATGGGTVISPEFDITGVPGTGGSGTFQGTINNGQQPVPDLLGYLPEPDPSTMIVQSNNPTHVSGTQTVTLNPGVYKGGIQVSGQGSLNLNPGIYYMNGGGFAFTGQGSLNANGVMIVNNPKSNSDVININGLGSINFSPMTSGIYQGISLWQVRSSSNTVTVSGNGSSSMSGTFYVAGGNLSVTGNGTNDVIGAQYISNTVTLGGGGDFSVLWNPNQTARTRIIGLVE